MFMMRILCGNGDGHALGSMRTLITRNHDLIMRNHDLIMKNSEGLSDVRERLARIEGHLRISPPPEHESDNGDDAARAA